MIMLSPLQCVMSRQRGSQIEKSGTRTSSATARTARYFIIGRTMYFICVPVMAEVANNPTPIGGEKKARAHGNHRDRAKLQRVHAELLIHIIQLEHFSSRKPVPTFLRNALEDLRAPQQENRGGPIGATISGMCALLLKNQPRMKPVSAPKHPVSRSRSVAPARMGRNSMERRRSGPFPGAVGFDTVRGAALEWKVVAVRFDQCGIRRRGAAVKP